MKIEVIVNDKSGTNIENVTFDDSKSSLDNYLNLEIKDDNLFESKWIFLENLINSKKCENEIIIKVHETLLDNSNLQTINSKITSNTKFRDFKKLDGLL